MKSIDEKKELMSALPRLKYSNINKISITDDYTKNERNEIAIWVQKADERKNNSSKPYLWKVRGTPDAGLYLTKIRKSINKEDVGALHRGQ